MTVNNSRRMLYPDLPTEEDGFRKPVPKLSNAPDVEPTTPQPSSVSPSPAPTTSRWGDTLADD